MKNAGFRARLAQLVGEERPYSWAARVGISKGAFMRIWNQGTVPSAELLCRIKLATGVSIDWLLTGEAASGQEAARTLSEEYVLVPIYDVRVSAGGGAEQSAEHVVDSLPFKIAWVRSELRVDPANLAGVRAHGDSMSPTLAEGDLVLLDRAQRRYRTEGIYVFRSEGLLLIKRLQSMRPGILQARSDNPAYAPFELKADEEGTAFKIIGRAIWAGKRL